MLFTHRNTFKAVVARTSLSQERRIISVAKNFFPFSAFFPFFQSSKFLKIVENSEFKTNKLSVNIQFDSIDFVNEKNPPAAWLLLFFSLSGALRSEEKSEKFFFAWNFVGNSQL